MTKKHIPDKLQAWIDARKKYRLSHVHVQMARELGLNPAKFGGYANHKQEPWKAPLPEYIEHLYFKRFKKDRPDRVLPIEELAREREQKRERKREAGPRKQEAETEPPAEEREKRAGAVEQSETRARLEKCGKDLSLRIPRSLALAANLKRDMEVELSVVDGKLVLCPVAKPKVTLEQLLAGVTDENLHGEVDWGPAVGREIW